MLLIVVPYALCGDQNSKLADRWQNNMNTQASLNHYRRRSVISSKRGSAGLSVFSRMNSLSSIFQRVRGCARARDISTVVSPIANAVTNTDTTTTT